MAKLLVKVCASYRRRKLMVPMAFKVGYKMSKKNRKVCWIYSSSAD